MNRFSSFKLQWRASASIAVAVAAIYAVSIAFAPGADTKAGDSKPAEAKPAKQTVKKLDGAALYATHCNRCHAERYATERTDAQWKTIMLHMQVRAQLPGKDAKAILKYLQENK
jgi:mono/diheme cytochrome c family protein